MSTSRNSTRDRGHGVNTTSSTSCCTNQHEDLLEDTDNEEDEQAVLKVKIIPGGPSNSSRQPIKCPNTPKDCSEQTEPVIINNPNAYFSHTISFEDYFKLPSVQKQYFINILSVQLFISLLCFIVAFVCTIISNQNVFLQNMDESLNTLILNSFLLLLFGCIYSLIIIRYQKLNHYPWFLVKIIIETFVRTFQAGLVVFWLTFACEKLRLYYLNSAAGSSLSQIELRAVTEEVDNKLLAFYHGTGSVAGVQDQQLQLQDNSNSNSKGHQDQEEKYDSNGAVPVYFCICLIYGLNLCLYLSLVLWLRFKTNAILDKFTIHLFSLGRICLCLLISIPLILTLAVDNGTATWDIAQVLLAVVCGLFDGFVTAYAFIGTVNSVRRNHGHPMKTANDDDLSEIQ